MPVYAYDVAPHLYVRLAPGVGADLALVGPLPEGGYEQIISEPRLYGWLQQSAPVQISLELAALPEVSAQSLRWTATSLAQALLAIGVQHLVVVLPPTAQPLIDELHGLAEQYAPALKFGCFVEKIMATQWLATRQAGVGLSTTPDEVRADAQQGRWVDAVARYRAMYAASLATAVEVVESLVAAAPEASAPAAEAAPAPAEPAPEAAPVQAAPPPEAAPTEAALPSIDEASAAFSQPAMAEGPQITEAPVQAEAAASPTSLVPSTEVPGPQGEQGPPPSIIVHAEAPSLEPEAPAGASPPPDPDEITRVEPPTSWPTATRASLSEHAASARGSVDFEDQQTVIRSGGEALFPAEATVSAEQMLEVRQRGGFDVLLRGLLSKTWFVASNDGERPAPGSGHDPCVLAHDAPRPGATLELGGARLARLLDDSCEQVRFSPDSTSEVTLRRHQLSYARNFLSGMRVESLLPSLVTHPEARTLCLAHDYLVLLERTENGNRAALLPGPGGELAAVLFTLPDALSRLLQRRTEPLAGLSLGALAEQGESLLCKLLTLPVQGILINPAGPGEPLFLPRSQLLPLLRADAPPPSAPTSSVTAASAVSRPAPPPDPPATPPASSTPSPVSSSTPPPAPEPAPAGFEEPAHSIGALSVQDSELLTNAAPPLHARSLVEAHFYLDIRGQERQDRYQWSEARGSETIWVFNTKNGDGQRGRFDFRVNEENPNPQGGYFGAGPSPLFGPVELVLLSGSMARLSSAVPYGLSPEEQLEALRRMEMAYILVMEALRFYTEEEPPAAALRTEDERRALAKDPERFRRSRVEEQARSYWTLASQLGEAIRGATA